MNGFVLGIAGEAETSNPEHTGPDDTENAPYVYSTQQEALNNTQFIQLQREFQLDMVEPITNMTRVAASAFTDSLDNRRQKTLPLQGSLPRDPTWNAHLSVVVGEMITTTAAKASWW